MPINITIFRLIEYPNNFMFIYTINQYKIYLQSIISAIFNEPYNFNPKIINTVLDLKNKSYFTNSKYIDSLDKFYSICSGITEISKYFEEEAYNKDRVVKYKNILEESSMPVFLKSP